MLGGNGRAATVCPNSVSEPVDFYANFEYDWMLLALFLYRKGNGMGLDDKFDSLKDEHQALENAIEKEESRPHPDDIEIASLKKQKLRIKDQIAGISVA